jgi:hypothetical protein
MRGDLKWTCTSASLPYDRPVLIVPTQITVKSDSVIQAFTKDGLSFKDGSEITADVICFATGWASVYAASSSMLTPARDSFEKDLRKTLSSVIGDVECSKLQPIWGVDVSARLLSAMKSPLSSFPFVQSEGEVRGAWRPSGRDHLWFHGGDTMTQRYYGKVRRPSGPTESVSYPDLFSSLQCKSQQRSQGSGRSV